MLEIIVSNSSDKPIYEQISSQIRALIMSGELTEGERLPSIRQLANTLHISVITTKRAYEELERDGFIDSVQGRGSFVSGGNAEFLREERIRNVEKLLTQAVAEAREAGVRKSELHDLLDLVSDEIEHGARA
ncbi:GntR family transcriptional regulator [Bifidobacterium magnum]|uniref:GntR family transcriptional regulator n=1 Tax=Bifidobacterium magnum TaxID=1692 RepID=A0A087BE60_9BIFI|nr:GntR family transcriptional regulator [Bifidobacterium magnum]KFI69310.1 GntR family transcriptional regulator [Bifidobacterium magnum]